MATTATSAVHSASLVAMDTIVTAKVVTDRPEAEVRRTLEQALGWFGEVERVCSRFDPNSELFRLSSQTGVAVQVSGLLFEAVGFALEVARLSGGAFDPTVGHAQARRGFDRNYATGERLSRAESSDASWRDVILDEQRGTISLRRPLLLDLGGVAKGLAIDLAAQDLDRLGAFSIDAGGDLYVKGGNELGDPWRIGIEHPRQPGLIATLALREGAVCTSGDYQRRQPGQTDEHHLLDPHTGRSPRRAISCTVVAPTAMAADALSTAAFVSGPVDGLRLLDEQGVDGMIVSSSLALSTTSHFERLLA
jgi:FAD:protein FMN transferase